MKASRDQAVGWPTSGHKPVQEPTGSRPKPDVGAEGVVVGIEEGEVERGRLVDREVAEVLAHTVLRNAVAGNEDRTGRALRRRNVGSSLFSATMAVAGSCIIRRNTGTGSGATRTMFWSCPTNVPAAGT